MAAERLAVAAVVCGLLPAARVRADGSGSLCPMGHYWGRAGSDPPSCKQYATPSIVDFGSFKSNTVAQRFANNQLLQVPVGGELYIKLSSNRITGAQSDLVPVLNNEEYGLPEFSSYTADGWFHMKARQAHGGEEYKVRCALDPQATCAHLTVDTSMRRVHSHSQISLRLPGSCLRIARSGERLAH